MKLRLKVTLIIGIFILLTLTFFSIDYLRVKKQENPIFCINTTTYRDGGTKEYYGIGYKVISFHTLEGFNDIKIGNWFMKYNDFKEDMVLNENRKQEIKNNSKYVQLEDIPLDSINYGLAEMVEDKYYIVMNSNTVYHKEELDRFIENVENNIPDKIRIVQYTIEGQPILKDLEYIKNKFILKVDMRWDGYALEEDKKITINEYDGVKYKLIKNNEPNVITDIKTYYSLELKSIETDEMISICDYAEVKEISKDKFEIQFSKQLGNEEKTKILGKDETDKYDYDIYSYKGKVDILIDGETMTLRDALIDNKISVDEILEKAHKDAKETQTIYGDYYMDGGSSVYIYNDYSILKYNTLAGKKDLYIGIPSMNINEL